MKFFMMALAHTEKDTIWSALQDYVDSSAQIIMAWEVAKGVHKATNGEHFHIAIDMDDKSYEAFKKTIIIKKYNLKGRAQDGTARQYGVIKAEKIRDETKFLSYTIKDNNYYSKNIDLEKLQKLYESSYQKEERKTKHQLLMEYLLDKQPEYPLTDEKYLDPFKIEFAIMEYYIGHLGERISKSQLKMLTVEYMMVHMPIRLWHMDYIHLYIMDRIR